MLHTKGTYELNGTYCEVRRKAPKAQGLWSAFRLLCNTMPDTSHGGRNGAEIDVFKSPYHKDPHKPGNYKAAAFRTPHVDGYAQEHKVKHSPCFLLDGIYDTFHTYGGYWDEREDIFCVDRKARRRTKWQAHPLSANI